MKLKTVIWWIDRDAKCFCGHSFGRCTGTWCPKENKPFHQAKIDHFIERHPRRFAQGGIA